MSGGSRSLPDRPGLRYLRLEAKRRLAAGEYELRQHFDDRMLAALPPGYLVEQTAKMAADLRAELVIISQAPLEAQVQLAGLRYYVAADPAPPHTAGSGSRPSRSCVPASAITGHMSC